MKTDNYDIEERLIDFAVDSTTLVENLPNSKSAIHLSSQLFIIQKNFIIS